MPAEAARGRGFLREALCALGEELLRPRARVRAYLRRAAHHMRRFPRLASLVSAILAGSVFVVYRSFAAGGVFLATFVITSVGLPAALVWAWPAWIAAGIFFCVWAALELGAGALWLGLALGVTVMCLYLASGMVFSLVGGAFPAYAVRRLGVGVSALAFAAGAAVAALLGRRIAPPIISAGWSAVCAAVACRIALLITGSSQGMLWTGNLLVGPWGLVPWTAASAIVAALLVWPHPRRGLEGETSLR